jgi:hypothetical protein
MDARSQIRQAMGIMPVSWLHLPALATSAPLPFAAKGTDEKALPIAAWAALGLVTGGGAAATGLYLNKKMLPPAILPQAVICNLTLKEIEDRAVEVYEDSLAGKDGGALQQIADSSSAPDAKVLPAIALAAVANPGAVAYLTGAVIGAGAVVAGAAAAR